MNMIERRGDDSVHLPIDTVIRGDCIEVMQCLPSERCHLIFADPPFNIGIDYDGYDDWKSNEIYIDWSRRWIEQAVRLLHPHGSLFIAIGDEYAGDIRVILRDFPLFFRNWIIWYYTFGQNARRKFNRSHTHILYFVKDKEHYTFNDADIRVASARQTVYNDKRANPRGKLPDDVWEFSRICGTFKERIGRHPCQMPEALMKRIVLVSSHKDDIVFDPFAGTGTTLAVAKKLDRHYLGIEASESYLQVINKRLEQAEMIPRQLSLPID